MLKWSVQNSTIRSKSWPLRVSPAQDRRRLELEHRDGVLVVHDVGVVDLLARHRERRERHEHRVHRRIVDRRGVQLLLEPRPVVARERERPDLLVPAVRDAVDEEPHVARGEAPRARARPGVDPARRREALRRRAPREGRRHRGAGAREDELAPRARSARDDGARTLDRITHALENHDRSSHADGGTWPTSSRRSHPARRGRLDRAAPGPRGPLRASSPRILSCAPTRDRSC
jgi:hypothetical protein